METDLQGTVEESGSADSSAGHLSTENTAAPIQDATHRTEAPAKDESFIDVSNLPEELKPHWKRMHGAYTKTREELKQGREALQAIQRFHSDPSYRDEVLRGMGLSVAQQQAVNRQVESQAAASLGEQGGAPPQVVERVKSKLPPELQWMAKSMADTQWEIVQSTLAPLQQREQQREVQSRNASFEEAAAELDAVHPGWDQQEKEMSSVLDWLNSGELRHKQYGNRLQRLYEFTQFLKGNDGAVVAKVQRNTANAARNRTSLGSVGRSQELDMSEKIRTSRTTHDAMQLAVQQAEAEMAKLGITLKD